MTLQDEMAAAAEALRAQRALRPHRHKGWLERPRCVGIPGITICSRALADYELGETACERCRERAYRQFLKSEERRRVRPVDTSFEVEW